MFLLSTQGRFSNCCLYAAGLFDVLSQGWRLPFLLTLPALPEPSPLILKVPGVKPHYLEKVMRLSPIVLQNQMLREIVFSVEALYVWDAWCTVCSCPFSVHVMSIPFVILVLLEPWFPSASRPFLHFSVCPPLHD